MYDPAPRRGPLTRSEWCISGVLLATFLGLFVAEILHNYEPVKLSALLIVIFWVPLLALHEAGHAIVASLLGWYVGQVVIGMGRTVSRFRIGSAAIEIRMLPLEGFVRCVPRNLRAPHFKSALIYFAGPGIEILMAGAVLLLVGPDRLLFRSNDYGVIVWQSLALAGVVQAALNLIPHFTRTPEGDVASDGLGIIRSFLQPESHYAAMIGQTYDQENQAWERHDPADWWKRNG
jgi:hypothetical protein